MKVLVIGSGGREHALCWKIRQSPLLEELYCAPGNPGIAEVADRVPIAVDEVHALAEFASGVGIDLTVVGPELPLTLGLVDEFQKRGLRVFGPTQRAAELEGSKVFSKQFMERHGIPTAEFRVAHDEREARDAAEELGLPVVLKADGLAAGKGVLMIHSADDLEEGLGLLFGERRFGAAGDRVVVERCLEGEEVSFIALADGERVLPLATSKDYKRIGEDDTGPNTGGMGAHSPSGVLGPEIASQVLESVMLRTVQGMAQEDRAFQGVLYAGLMLTADGPKVLEFNVRFGDPECQPLMMRCDDDLLEVLVAGADGAFQTNRLRFRQEVAACIVLASQGYPGKPVSGEAIEGIAEANALPGVAVFQAGTKEENGRILSSGGRVLNVCALGEDLVGALRLAYGASQRVSWPSKIFRRDIGKRVLAR